MVVAATAKPLLPEVRLSQEASYPAGLPGQWEDRYKGKRSIPQQVIPNTAVSGTCFTNQVISNIAQGNYGQVGSIKGADAQKAFTSYMGIKPGGGSSYDNVEIGGGRITGTETGSSGNRDFALYHADQYAAPTQGAYSTFHLVQAVCTGYGRKSTIYFRQRQSILQ